MRWIAVTVLLSSSVAYAEEPAQDDGGFVFAATQFGLGTPLGLFGVEAGVGYDWFRAAAGVGIGTGGPQVGATLRAFTTMSGIDVGVGLGLSKGAGPSMIAPEGEEKEIPMFAADTYWTNAELVVEVPLTSWSFARFVAGASYAVGGGCEDSEGPCDGLQRAELEEKRWMPYAGVAAVLRFPEGPARTTFQIPGTPPPFQFPNPPPPY